MSEEMEMNLEQAAENSAEVVSDEVLSDAEVPAQETVAEGAGENENIHWYVVHTYSGYENKVKANLEKTIENRHLQDQILEVLVPLQDVVETDKNNKS